MTIDLHRQLTLPWQDAIWSFEELWERRVDVSVAGFSLPTLGREDRILYLLIHGSKPDHAWSRICWLLDVAMLMKKEPAIDWRWVWRRAEAHGFGRAVRLGLLLVERVLAHPVPAQLTDLIAADAVAEQLAQEVAQRLGSTIAELERDDWGFRRRYIARIVERPRDRVRQLVYYVTCPTFNEIELVRLPRSLAPAYVPLRMLRLACLAAFRPLRRAF